MVPPTPKAKVCAKPVNKLAPKANGVHVSVKYFPHKQKYAMVSTTTVMAPSMRAVSVYPETPANATAVLPKPKIKGLAKLEHKPVPAPNNGGHASTKLRHKPKCVMASTMTAMAILTDFPGVVIRVHPKRRAKETVEPVRKPVPKANGLLAKEKAFPPMNNAMASTITAMVKLTKI